MSPAAAPQNHPAALGDVLLTLYSFLLWSCAASQQPCRGCRDSKCNFLSSLSELSQPPPSACPPPTAFLPWEALESSSFILWLFLNVFPLHFWSFSYIFVLFCCFYYPLFLIFLPFLCFITFVFIKMYTWPPAHCFLTLESHTHTCPKQHACRWSSHPASSKLQANLSSAMVKGLTMAPQATRQL